MAENIGVPAMATRAIHNRISTLVPLVKVSRRVRDGTTVDEQLDDHALKVLLDHPHPNITRAQLLGLTGDWIVTVGEAYWLKVANRLQVPTELHPIPPDKCWPILRQGVVDGYIITDGNGKQTELPADVIVRFFIPDPENVFGSEGYLGPSGVTADSLKFASQHLRRHYQDDATPKTVCETGPDATAFGPGERRRFYAEWRQRYHSRLGTEAGTPGILPLGYKLVEMAMQTGVEIVPLLEHLTDEQLMGMGVPKSILGKVVSGDRSSAETNQYVFDLHTISPIAGLIADALTLQLAPDFDANLFVEFDEFVSEDKRFRLEQEVADLTHKVRSINLVREDRTLDPVPWGEDPVGKIGEMPYDPDMAYEIDLDAPGALQDEEPEKEPEELEEPRSRGNGRGNGYFTPEAEWERQLAREKAYVPSFEKEMKKILGIQERKTIKKLKALVPRARVNGYELFDPQEWAELFERRVEPVRLKAFEAILTESLEGFGIDEFVFPDEMRFLLKQQGALLVKHANATTQSMIAQQIQAATAEGEGVDQIAKRIQSVFRTRRHHARTIARTEVLKASQEAQLASFDLADVESNRWNTSMDDAVRDSHRAVQGQVQPKGVAFDLLGEPALAPGVGLGHGQLSAGNTINCRCFLTPVVEG
jgi:SPP1 gp7 family putative phage head morphogenesis protein